MAVYRALLYFNLPQNIVFKPVKPVKVFSVQPGGYHGGAKQSLKDLISELNIGQTDSRFGGMIRSSGLLPNLILMQVEVPIQQSHQADRLSTLIIGGYASHQWRPNSQQGD